MHLKAIWRQTPSLADLQQRSLGTLVAHLGIEFLEVGPDFLTARLPVDAKTLQAFGDLHGGASAALAETVASVAANYCVDCETHFCVGLELNINHIRSVQKGWVVAIARPLHLGRSTQVWDIRLETEREERQLTATARLTLLVRTKKKPAP